MLGLHAAVQRFPSQAGKIQDLLASDEAFQGMCDDLATAEQVLSAVDQLPAGIRIERRLEYERLVEELANEIENALHRSNIIPISRPQRP
uniref:hypothetical protein n=1 Tax=uncultured Rhizobium sp. TaxID=155567 RepID=UPI00260A9972|nr:hypothetical protein [uncultured Rhizobium sp.]